MGFSPSSFHNPASNCSFLIKITCSFCTLVYPSCFSLLAGTSLRHLTASVASPLRVQALCNRLVGTLTVWKVPCTSLELELLPWAGTVFSLSRCAVFWQHWFVPSYTCSRAQRQTRKPLKKYADVCFYKEQKLLQREGRPHVYVESFSLKAHSLCLSVRQISTAEWQVLVL